MKNCTHLENPLDWSLLLEIKKKDNLTLNATFPKSSPPPWFLSGYGTRLNVSLIK